MTGSRKERAGDVGSLSAGVLGRLEHDGRASWWSTYIQVAGLRHLGEGAGVAFANLDSNPRPEMRLMDYDAPEGASSFRYRVGWSMNTAGLATHWSNYVQAWRMTPRPANGFRYLFDSALTPTERDLAYTDQLLSN